ncbi:hypothetical protein C8J57DRAFT_1599632 [Mycena rebaudengoi]|nr:hypothetical protein C8J57DRAFT_1599632 [Mycena rebaudengoi]
MPAAPNTRTCRLLRAVPAAIRTQAGVTNPAVLPTANSPQPGPVDLTAILEGAFSPAALPAHRQFGSIGSQADLTRATKWSPIVIEEALVFWWFCSTDALETESRNRKNISNMRKTRIFGTCLRNRNIPPEVADGSVAPAYLPPTHTLNGHPGLKQVSQTLLSFEQPISPNRVGWTRHRRGGPSSPARSCQRIVNSDRPGIKPGYQIEPERAYARLRARGDILRNRCRPLLEGVATDVPVFPT